LRRIEEWLDEALPLHEQAATLQPGVFEANAALASRGR
jgi:hypothetical protein